MNLLLLIVIVFGGINCTVVSIGNNLRTLNRSHSTRQSLSTSGIIGGSCPTRIFVHDLAVNIIIFRSRVSSCSIYYHDGTSSIVARKRFWGSPRRVLRSRSGARRSLWSFPRQLLDNSYALVVSSA